MNRDTVARREVLGGGYTGVLPPANVKLRRDVARRSDTETPVTPSKDEVDVEGEGKVKVEGKGKGKDDDDDEGGKGNGDDDSEYSGSYLDEDEYNPYKAPTAWGNKASGKGSVDSREEEKNAVDGDEYANSGDESDSGEGKRRPATDDFVGMGAWPGEEDLKTVDARVKIWEKVGRRPDTTETPVTPSKDEGERANVKLRGRGVARRAGETGDDEALKKSQMTAEGEEKKGAGKGNEADSVGGIDAEHAKLWEETEWDAEVGGRDGRKGKKGWFGKGGSAGESVKLRRREVAPSSDTEETPDTEKTPVQSEDEDEVEVKGYGDDEGSRDEGEEGKDLGLVESVERMFDGLGFSDRRRGVRLGGPAGVRDVRLRRREVARRSHIKTQLAHSKRADDEQLIQEREEARLREEDAELEELVDPKTRVGRLKDAAIFGERGPQRTGEMGSELPGPPIPLSTDNR